MAAVPASVRTPGRRSSTSTSRRPGTASGGLDEFWDLIWKHRRLTGGAVWDWMSPGMLARWRTTPDLSPNHVEASLMAGATLVNGRFGHAVVAERVRRVDRGAPPPGDGPGRPTS